jgi:hypothetical protein
MRPLFHPSVIRVPVLYLAALAMAAMVQLLFVPGGYASKLYINPTPRAEMGQNRSVLYFPINTFKHCNQLQVLTQPEAGQSVLQLDTATTKGAKPQKANRSYENRNLKSYTAELDADKGRFQLFIKHNTPYTVEAKCFDTSLQVAIAERYMQVESSRDVARGLKYKQYKAATEPGKAFRTHQLEWEPHNSDVRLAALMPVPGALAGLKPTYQTLAQYSALAGVNASFFNHILKIPLGIVVRDGELLNGTLFNRVAFGLDAGNAPHMAHLEMKGSVRTGDWQQRINIVNMPRISGSQVALYTSLWGTASPPAGGGNVAILIRNGRMERGTLEGPMPIRDSDDWVLYGRASDLQGLMAAATGQPVDVILATDPDWSDKHLIVAGGPQLLKNGSVNITLQQEQFNALPPDSLRPRTAIGIHPDDKVTLLVVDSSLRGASLRDTAELLRLAGAVDGMNLDGGTSSQLVVRQDVRFAASGKYGAPVSTSLGFLPMVPLP